MTDKLDRFCLDAPDFASTLPCKVWVLLDGEEAPPNTTTTPTRHPHIQLAWRLEVDNGQQERESRTGYVSADEETEEDTTIH